GRHDRVRRARGELPADPIARPRPPRDRGGRHDFVSGADGTDRTDPARPARDRERQPGPTAPPRDPGAPRDARASRLDCVTAVRLARRPGAAHTGPRHPHQGAAPLHREASAAGYGCAPLPARLRDRGLSDAVRRLLRRPGARQGRHAKQARSGSARVPDSRRGDRLRRQDAPGCRHRGGRPRARAAGNVAAVAGRSAGTALRLDVTDEDSVAAGFDHACRTFGGVDILVANAGVAHVSALADTDARQFRKVLDVNLGGYFLTLRAAARVMRLQGTGGNVIINASKNVFAPGADFGAYSASKAAGHQLGKVAAIELAPLGIRVNMINADAVFAEGDTPSGLWREIGPDRARSRGIPPEKLQEFYRERNLLHAEITGAHVGRAVVFF